MPGELRVQELLTLKTIAETLNQSNDLHQMLNEVLEKLLQVTGLQTGWIFLVGEEPEYTCVADCNLPPALAWGDKTPMCRDRCWCIGGYWDGELQHPANIINCKRIEDAIKYSWGDTKGIYHHATVPLTAGGERFGILNVAAPGKRHFTDEELALLQAVAYQIGTAVERIRLFQAEQRRAESYAKLGEVSQHIGSVLETDRLPIEVVQTVGSTFHWQSVALYLLEGAHLSLRAVHSNGESRVEWKQYQLARSGAAGAALQERRPVVVVDAQVERRIRARRGQPPYRSAVAVPLRLREESVGVLVVGSDRARAFDGIDVEIVEALSVHVSLAIENARLYEQRQILTREEERNRLARDLHDSVCQTLFSLTLTTRGAESMVTVQPELAGKALQDIQGLAQNALREMRSLIWQLRPVGLEEGLCTALKRYGESLGLCATAGVEGVRSLPRAIEEALWRIGQESLNNVRKHAATDHVEIRIRLTDADVSLEVADRGCGFITQQPVRGRSLGMESMRERAQALGGTFSVQSRPGEGTVTRTWIPCPSRSC